MKIDLINIFDFDEKTPLLIKTLTEGNASTASMQNADRVQITHKGNVKNMYEHDLHINAIAHLESLDGTCMVILKDDVICGFLRYSQIKEYEIPVSGIILKSIYISKEFRRFGIASRVIKNLINDTSNFAILNPLKKSTKFWNKLMRSFYQSNIIDCCYFIQPITSKLSKFISKTDMNMMFYNQKTNNNVMILKTIFTQEEKKKIIEALKSVGNK
jgi:GNAT superfamily N-acetyltransferase